ncbi:MAG: CPBP family intramembrane glutamic endopeptidase [Bryobacteraceae bacterium]
MHEEPVNSTMPARPERVSTVGLLLRAGFFLLLIWLAMNLFGLFLNETLGYFPAATLSPFLASVLASAIVVRIYERGRLEDVGMGWSHASGTQFWQGLAAGAAGAALVTGGALMCGLATWVKNPDPAAGFGFGKLAMVATLLLFGAVGEELMFRGYAFQLLAGALGLWRVTIPFGILFALMHLGNLYIGSPAATGHAAMFSVNWVKLGAEWLGIVNTGLWGVLFCVATWRSGALWLPIGLHFGWNIVLPLFGARLSGFTLVLTGYELKWTSNVWLSGGEYGPEGSVLTTAACGLLLLWLWRSRLHRQPSLLLDARQEPLE